MCLLMREETPIVPIVAQTNDREGEGASQITRPHVQFKGTDPLSIVTWVALGQRS